MHEYEFRLVVESESPFRLTGYAVQTVYYVKPHFRYANGKFETKRKESTRAVYHDGIWFQWVHSVETPYAAWSRSTCQTFLHNIGNFQDPVRVETRNVVTVDDKAKLYTFRHGPGRYRLILEWEHGVFAEPVARFDPSELLAALDRYKPQYDAMRQFRTPGGYALDETLHRRPVACIRFVPEGGDRYLYAHKLDGTFGLVYSYGDGIKEKWEGYECVIRRGVTLGDGLVFAAEKLDSGRVCLLDVYRVRGHETAGWCRRGVLTRFLPGLDLVAAEGYFVQTYVSDRRDLNPSPPFPVDGLIVHDVEEDAVYKYKTRHSLDLVYYGGYFYLPDGRIKCDAEGLEEGSVYEISTEDGSVMRKRTDRFKGNTAAQVESVLEHGWHGPAIEPLPSKNLLKRKK